MNIIDALLGEHAVLYALFDQLEACADNPTTLEQLVRAAEPVASVLVSHARVEDDLLFPSLEQQLGPDGLLAIMREEHEEIDSLFRAIARASDVDATCGDVIHVLDLAREHFEKEEQVVFPDARDVLGAELCAELGEQWAKRRRVALGE